MAQPKILQLDPVVFNTELWTQISQHAAAIVPKSSGREGFLQECKSGAFEGVRVIFRSPNSVDATGRFDAQLIDHLPFSVKFICHNAAGYDQIDIEACTKRGIRVSNVPDMVNEATADTAIFLMLGALRNFNAFATTLRRGEWWGNPAPAFGHDPQGKVLGILGMGGIGRSMAKKALAFGMEIQYYNRTQLPEEIEKECRAKYVSFEEVLSKSDVISLNLPLNISRMKAGVVIVNTARGPVIDEEALVQALNDGHVGSVGLDVFENEPEVHPGLLSNPRAMLLPHVGTSTVETEAKMERLALENVKVAVTEGRLKTLVPEQVSN